MALRGVGTTLKSTATVIALLLTAASMSTVLPASAGMAPFERATVDWAGAIEEYRSYVSDGNLEGLRSLREVVEVLKKQVTPTASGALERNLATINAATSLLHGSISAAGSPVLMPIDIKRLLADLAQVPGKHVNAEYFGGAGQSEKAPYYLSNLAFHPGPYGYRAYFQLGKTSTLLISGSSLLYRLSGNPQMKPIDSCTTMIKRARAGDPSASEEFNKYLARYEKLIGEEDAEYFSEREATVPCTFAGALVEINILCDKFSDPDCKVESVAKQIFAALHFVGGGPRPADNADVNDPIQRLSNEIDELDASVKLRSRPAYGMPGKLVPDSAVGGGDKGSSDLGVYGPILFPVELATFGHTVVFRGNVPADTCLNGVPCQWIDNFCEKRSANYLPTCPSSSGHAGQDIWAPKWNTTSPHPLRAVVDGIAFRRFPAQPAVTVSDINGTNIDYVYRHMRPSELQRQIHASEAPTKVTRGCVLANADKFQGIYKDQRKPVDTIKDGDIHYSITSRHLHFEIRIPTKFGFQNVSPYVTLVNAHAAAVTRADTSKAATGRCPPNPPAKR